MKLSLALLVFVGSQQVTREVHLMGTRAVLTAYSADEAAGQRQLEKYLRILEDSENELSVWRAGTALSRLNATKVGDAFHADTRLFGLLDQVSFWWKETGRTFDPGIGRILQARGFYGRDSVPPASPVASGMQHFTLDAATRRIIREADAWFDSGAFGKGEALDRVHRQAEGDGDEPWLIDLGGQIMAYGRPHGKPSWTVDLAHPRHRDEAVLAVKLKFGSLATTGNSEQPGHILDPRTGAPVEFAGSVAVWHERALVADIVSTALFVMGPEQGTVWAESRGIAACFLIPDEGSIRLQFTRAFSKLIQ
jgi:thiamine biosynthesis lipoprotein